MSHNLAACQSLAKKATSAGARALFLPEAADYIAGSSEESVSLCQPARTSPFVLGLQRTAKESSLFINVGIHEPTEPPSNRIRNTLIWIDNQGNIAHRYQKLHMFDIDLRPGGPRLKESDSSEPGKELVQPYDGIPGMGRIGSLICFDVRFPEPSLALRRLGSDIILYPSAFTVPTGKQHWEVLLRARAIETQSWVLAAAQCGRHNGKRVSYGDTIAIDPTGKIVDRLDRVGDADAEQEGARQPQLLTVNIDLDVNNSVRRGIPLVRRTDVYAEL